MTPEHKLISQMVEALRFYADRENYKICEPFEFSTPISQDCGDGAKQALALAEQYLGRK